MLEERARRTARRPERCQEPSIGRQRPAREEPRRGPAPLTARGVASTAQERAQVLRAPRPPGAASAAPAHPRAVFPPNLGTARLGTKREGAPGSAGRDAPSGSEGSPWWRPLPPPCPRLTLRRPTCPSRASPQVLPHTPSGPAPGPPPLSRPCGRPSPAGGVPRNRLLHRASARPAGRRLMCPASPSPSPPPSSLLLLLLHRRLRFSLRPRPKPLPPPRATGRRLRTARRGGGGGVPPRSGSRGCAARGAVVGGGVRSAGAEARASNFPRWGPRAPGRGSGAALVGTTQARGVWALGGRSLRLPDSSFLQLDPQDRNSAVGSASLRAGN